MQTARARQALSARGGLASVSTSQSLSAHLDSVVAAFVATGDHDKVIQGLYENMLLIPYHDPLMDKTAKCIEWFGIGDMWGVNYPNFVPYVAVALHLAVAQPSLPRLQLPKKDYERRMVEQRNQSIVQSLLQPSGHLPSFFARHGLGRERVVAEVLPSLLVIISPRLRPSNAYMLTEMEKRDVRALVLALVACGLDFKGERTFQAGRDGAQHGMFVHNLDPPIQMVSQYTDLSPSYVELPIKLRSIVAHEVQLEVARRVHRAEQQHAASGVPPFASPSSSSAASASALPSASRLVVVPVAVDLGPGLATTAQRTRLSSNAMAKAAAVTFADHSGGDSKGAALTDPDASQPRPQSFMQQQRKKRAERVRHPIHFNFQEGFTNAVRRPVKIQDLLRLT
jgi:chromosome transmission fidelity protein 18